MKCASTCIWTWYRVSAQISHTVHRSPAGRPHTISRAPRSTPTKMLENQSSSCARPSSGNSTKSASGFSSKMRENCLLSLVQFVIVGVILRKILKPTWNNSSDSGYLYPVLLAVGKPWISSLPLHGNSCKLARLTSPESLQSTVCRCCSPYVPAACSPPGNCIRSLCIIARQSFHM